MWCHSHIHCLTDKAIQLDFTAFDIRVLLSDGLNRKEIFSNAYVPISIKKIVILEERHASTTMASRSTENGGDCQEKMVTFRNEIFVQQT